LRVTSAHGISGLRHFGRGDRGRLHPAESIRSGYVTDYSYPEYSCGVRHFPACARIPDRDCRRPGAAQRLYVVGATLPPRDEWGNADAGGVREATRQAVNHWIRTSGEYDAVADFDLATRHPGNPSRLLPEYDSGDGIHLSDAGNQAMADAVDVRQLIEDSPSRSRCARRR
jgi:hypothetical protein